MSCLCKKKRVSRKKLEEVIRRLYEDKAHYLKIFKNIFSGLSDDFFEDMFQDFALKVFKKYHLFNPNRDFKKWTASVFERACVDGTRRKKACKRECLELPSEEVLLALTQIEKQRTDKDMIDAMEELEAVNSPYSYLVVDSYLMGYSIKELAEEMGAPENTVKTRKRAVMVKLEERAKK